MSEDGLFALLDKDIERISDLFGKSAQDISDFIHLQIMVLWNPHMECQGLMLVNMH